MLKKAVVAILLFISSGLSAFAVVDEIDVSSVSDNLTVSDPFIDDPSHHVLLINDDTEVVLIENINEDEFRLIKVDANGEVTALTDELLGVPQKMILNNEGNYVVGVNLEFAEQSLQEAPLQAHLIEVNKDSGFVSGISQFSHIDDFIQIESTGDYLVIGNKFNGKVRKDKLLSVDFETAKLKTVFRDKRGTELNNLDSFLTDNFLGIDVALTTIRGVKKKALGLTPKKKKKWSSGPFIVSTNPETTIVHSRSNGGDLIGFLQTLGTSSEIDLIDVFSRTGIQFQVIDSSIENFHFDGTDVYYDVGTALKKFDSTTNQTDVIVEDASNASLLSARGDMLVVISDGPIAFSEALDRDVIVLRTDSQE